mgnify:CR=1 FL=1
MPESNAFDAFEDMQGMYQTGTRRAVLALRGQVYLGDVAGDDDLGAEAQAGEEHLHLLPGGVLGLVQDDEAVVQGTAGACRQRGHLDVAPLQVL